MNRHSFILEQFCQDAGTIRPCLAITGSVGRQADALFLQYQISGDIHDLHIPRRSGLGSRRHDLWKGSCFEAFIGLSESERYWEVNLSPNGDWNVYSFSDYRQDMVEELALSSLPCTFYETRTDLWLDLIVDLRALFREDHPLDLGISCVLKHHSGDLTLWALCHPGARADFHHRSSFTLTL